MHPALNVHPEDSALARQLIAEAEQALRGARRESAEGYHVSAMDSCEAARATLEMAERLLTPKPAAAAEIAQAA